MVDKIKNNQLIINKPYIEIKDNRAYLKADIKEADKEYTLFFSVDIAYKDALCYEVADCFLVACMTHAMIEKLDIVSKAPISRHILYSLKTRLIPQLDKHTKRYNYINIIAEPSDIKFDGHAVGTGWSGGVDCLYTFINTLHCEEENHRLTHILNINAGVFKGNDSEIHNKFCEATKKTKKVADRFGLSAIDVDTNLHLLFNELYSTLISQRLCSAVLSLQHLFSIYYFSSAVESTVLSYDEADSAYYEYIVCSCLSTQNLTFIDFGSEVTRIEKIKQISDSPMAQEHLHVCVKDINHNCTRCDKCIRTIGALYALGALDNFSKVFDSNYIMNNFNTIFGYIIYRNDPKLGDNKQFKQDLDMLKDKGIELPTGAYRYAKVLEVTRRLALKQKDIIIKETSR